MANILVIEDEIRVATLIKRGLDESGHTVYTAFDIATAKRLLHEIFRYYEKLPKPTLISTQEYIEGKVYHKNPTKEKDKL